MTTLSLSSPSLSSASGLDMGKIEEMEKMLREAHAEKSRLMESRVRLTGTRRQQVVSTELPSAFPVPFHPP